MTLSAQPHRTLLPANDGCLGRHRENDRKDGRSPAPSPTAARLPCGQAANSGLRSRRQGNPVFRGPFTPTAAASRGPELPEWRRRPIAGISDDHSPTGHLVIWLRDAFAWRSRPSSCSSGRSSDWSTIRRSVPSCSTPHRNQGQQAALEQAFNLLDNHPSALKAGVMKPAANIQGMLHAFASGEVMKHALASYSFEQFEAACYQALVTTAEEAGEREVASTSSTILREEQAMAPGSGRPCRSSPSFI